MCDNTSPPQDDPEVIDLTQDDDEDSAFSATTINLNPSENNEALQVPTPKYVINLHEKNPFRGFIKLSTLSPSVVDNLQKDSNNFVAVWPVFDGLINRTYHYAKTANHDAGFAYYVLKTVIMFILNENQSDYNTDALIRKAFTVILLTDARFPRDISRVMTKKWRSVNFRTNVAWWQYVIGVKRIIDAYKHSREYPDIHVEVARFDFNE